MRTSPTARIDHPLIHLPKIFGIDFSVTKHVFMLWLVAALLFLVVTAVVRRYLQPGTEHPVPRGVMNALEAVVEFIRDSIVAAQRRQQVGADLDAAAADALPVHPRRRTSSG